MGKLKTFKNIIWLVIFVVAAVSFLAVFVMPGESLAQDPLGPLVEDCEAGDASCGLSDLVALVQRVINWLLVVFAPIAMIMFAWAGFLMVTARGNTGQIDKAKGIFTSVAIGLVIMLAAWLIVYTITNTLLKDPDLPVGLEPL